MTRTLLTGAASLLIMMFAGLRAEAETAQEIYNAAQAAFDKADWNGTISGFGRVLPPPGKPLSPSQGVIAQRLSYALLRQGRFEEARAMAARAATALSASDPRLQTEALATESEAARGVFDDAEAATAARRALAVAEKAGDVADVVNLKILLSKALTTSDPAGAARAMDDVLSDQKAMATLNPKQMVAVFDIRARAAMNAGDLDTAVRYIERAVAKAGGLTEKVSISDVAIRTDAAIIYSLRKSDDNTRRYMAYTGAGHLKNANWITAYDGELPVCSEENDIRPNDTVIVWFAIAPDGHVFGVEPIYASRPGTLGGRFAQAVSGWRWNPDLVKAVEPFWLNALVVQLRCQTRPDPERLDRPIVADFSNWLATKGVDSPGRMIDSFVAADDTRLQRDDLGAVPALLARYRHASDKEGLGPRLQAILAKNAAPASGYALLLDEEASRRSDRSASQRARHRLEADVLKAGIPAIEQRFPNDQALAWLKLEQALDLEEAGSFDEAAPLLRAIEQTPTAVLSDDSPIRKVALLHQSLVARRLGTASGGEAKLAASGLTADQCSLFDTHPIHTGGTMGSGDFPTEALRWGFEGAVKEAFDIDDQGRVANIRTIFAYPPFIFAPATESALRSFRYEPPRIGGRAVGCTSQAQSVRYNIPGR